MKTMKLDIGLLILRVFIGGMMLFSHGMGKLLNFGSLSTAFADPFGAGPMISLSLAVFAEVVCSVFVMIGLATRIACIPLVITMAVAAGMIHSGDPWAKKEFALLYLIPFLALIFTGPGRLSLDQIRGRR
jgi:putative oxidoreductase